MFSFLLHSPGFAEDKSYEWVKVLRVVDGGTIKVVNDEGFLKTIRLIGIDAPITAFYNIDAEIHGKSIFFYGRKARDFLESIVKGKQIKLCFDRIRKSQNGSILAYIWIKNELLNEKLLKEGYAYLDVTTPFNKDYQQKFFNSEKFAIENNLGLWDLRTSTDEKIENLKKPKQFSNEQATVFRTIVKEDKVKVCRVIDAETIEVIFKDKNKEKIKLIGIITPKYIYTDKKVEHFGKKASDYLRKNLENQEIILTYDKMLRGRYGKLLAFVWKDDKLINDKIIRDGYAYYYLKYPLKSSWTKMFKESQRYAILNNLGLWKKYKINTNYYNDSKKPKVKKQIIKPVIYQKQFVKEYKKQFKIKYLGNKKSRVYHRLDCYSASIIKPTNKVYFKTRQEAIDAGYRACMRCTMNSDQLTVIS